MKRQFLSLLFFLASIHYGFCQNHTLELQKLIEQAQAGDGIIRLEEKVYCLDTITLPIGVRLDFTPKSRLRIDSDNRLILNCELKAGLHPIFEGEGEITGRPVVERVYPQWFGAIADGFADDGLALRRAAEFAGISTGKMLFIPHGRYNYSLPVRINSNVDCHGVLIANLDLDLDNPRDKWFLKWIPVKNYAMVRIIPDQPTVNLDPEFFYDIQANDMRLKHYQSIPLEDNPQHKINLDAGGTLFLKSSDFFSSRNVLNQDQVYEKNDICRVVSQQGDVFPEFVFSYPKSADAAEWSAEKVYIRGDYVKSGGQIYRASFPSGPGSVLSNRDYGQVEVGPVDPETDAAKNIVYEGGRKDSLRVWRPIRMSVSYTPPQTPLTINGLRVEVESKQVVTEPILVQNAALVRSERSDTTFNNLAIINGKRHLRLSCLGGVQNCVSNVFNNCFFSGATSQGSGYNFTNGNAADITYNNCVSGNCRDGMAGRHGKNITINGGHYNVIDDHYGNGYIIRGVTFHCIQPWIDGFYTAKNDPANWYFRTGNAAIAYGGGNIIIENCRVIDGKKLLTNRADIGDFYGNIIIRNISVVTDQPFNIILARETKNFDYAHQVRTPSRVFIENVTVTGKGKLNLDTGYWNTKWNMLVRDCPDIGLVRNSSVAIDFFNCGFEKTKFILSGSAVLNVRDSVFKEPISGFSPEFSGILRDNLYTDGKEFSLENLSPAPIPGN